MRVDRRAAVFGAVLMLAALPAFLVLPAPSRSVVALGLLVTGAFVLVVVTTRTVRAEAAEALVLGGAESLGDVASALHLRGRPVYVPDQGNVGTDRVFLPLDDGPRMLPTLDRGISAYGGTGETRMGIAVTTPATRLVDAHERLAGVRARDLSAEEVGAFLSALVRDHDLARRLAVEPSERGFEVRFSASSVRPPCFDDPTDPTCVRTGCALCHTAGVALARAIARPLVAATATVEPPSVTLRFAPVEEGT